MTKLFIKNMVCNRCKYVVATELQKLGYQVTANNLGEVEIKEELNAEEMKEINNVLLPFGFELMDDEKIKVIETVKGELLKLVNNESDARSRKLSVLLSEKLLKEYKYLSDLFSKVEGQTIEHYFINLKIEKAKELLIYNEMALGEIADVLHYSSTAHLSSQFKAMTGMTPSQFKKLKEKNRISLDKI